MKIAAILTVKDEAEILEDCIAHLRAIGVEQIIAHDAGSTDGSEQILARHAGPDFRVVQHSDMDPDAEAWAQLHADLARDSGADWVMFLDADEFWMPATGRLQDCRALADADILNVPRFNVALGPDGPLIEGSATPFGAGTMQLICKPPEGFRVQLESNTGLPWIRGVPVPKIMVRPTAIGEVADAGHDVIPPTGTVARRTRPADLLIAHLPFTTLARFSKKLANVRKVFEVHSDYFGADLAWHWRRWLALEDEEAVSCEFSRQIFDESTLADFRRQGIVQSNREIFAAAASSACARDAS
jgi:glycosyltransferase involved in cell wall biosynthesis